MKRITLENADPLTGSDVEFDGDLGALTFRFDGDDETFRLVESRGADRRVEYTIAWGVDQSPAIGFGRVMRTSSGRWCAFALDRGVTESDPIRAAARLIAEVF